MVAGLVCWVTISASRPLPRWRPAVSVPGFCRLIRCLLPAETRDEADERAVPDPEIPAAGASSVVVVVCRDQGGEVACSGVREAVLVGQVDA